MLATGGSAEMAISYLRERGVKDIRMLCIVAAPEGLKSLTEKDPDVHIYTCAIDDHLNEAAYIVPGPVTPATASTARSSRWALSAAVTNTKKWCARASKVVHAHFC